MIQIIAGEKGKGKTKQLLDKVNTEIKTAHGSIVYLDKNAKHMYELNNKIRLPGGLVGIMAVLWRFTAEYLPFLLGAVVSIRAFGSNVLSMKNLRKGEDQQ